MVDLRHPLYLYKEDADRGLVRRILPLVQSALEFVWALPEQELIWRQFGRAPF